MRAWRVQEYGPYNEVLRWQDDVAPEAPVGASARVQVTAAGVNFADTLRIAGKYQVKNPLPFTPGTEVVGKVVEAGPDSRYNAGQRVMGVAISGAFAEEATVADNFSWPVPDEVDDATAAALLVTYQTSHLALRRRADLQPGETLLVHGGAGGVGSAAIQLGKAMGATVIATAGGSDKLEICRQAGADHAIDYRAEDFIAAVKQLTGGRGADVIYDPVGGGVFDQSTKCIAWEGRLLVIGFAGGRIPEIAANRILLKNISVVGLNWPNYAVQDHDVLDEVQADLMRLVASGAVRPILHGTMPLGELPAALDAVVARAVRGKLVLVP